MIGIWANSFQKARGVRIVDFAVWSEAMWTARNCIWLSVFSIGVCIDGQACLAQILDAKKLPQPRPFVIKGTVEFDGGDPAKDVDVFLKTERGNVATKLDSTNEKGEFSFSLPPPNAKSYKLFIWPFGIEQNGLAPKAQVLSIRVPVEKKISAEAWLSSLNVEERRTVIRKYADFSKGVLEDKELTHALREKIKGMKTVAKKFDD